jgi:hypothetical protein
VLADLDDVARTQAAAGRPVPAWLDGAREAMRRWLAAVALPGGALPLLNDAWEGPPVERSTSPFRDLADSGYVVLRHGEDQAVLDVGPVAPAHLPPHAHADVLSFVLWIDGAPVVVDPGTFAYEGPERAAFRGTGAHSTVEVDGHDQCDLWGPFRAAHMPATTRLVTERRDGVVVIAAEVAQAARGGQPADPRSGPEPGARTDRAARGRAARGRRTGDGRARALLALPRHSRSLARALARVCRAAGHAVGLGAAAPWRAGGARERRAARRPARRHGRVGGRRVTG